MREPAGVTQPRPFDQRRVPLLQQPHGPIDARDHSSSRVTSALGSAITASAGPAASLLFRRSAWPR